MFDRFFKERDNKNANKAEKRNEMTEYTHEPITEHDHNNHVHLGYIQADEVTEEDLTVLHVDEQDIAVDSVEEDIIVAESLEAQDVHPAKVEKPEYFTGVYTSLSDGKASSSFRQVTSGPQVAYVNSVLGVEGDRYTDETTAAVTEYQKKNGLRVTGKVSPAMYRNL